MRTAPPTIEHLPMKIRMPFQSMPFQSGRRRPGIASALPDALAVASQMALLYPPGLDEWVRRELSGRADTDRGQGR